MLGQCCKRLRVRLSRAFSSEEPHDLHRENRGVCTRTSRWTAGRRRHRGARQNLWRRAVGHRIAGNGRVLLGVACEGGRANPTHRRGRHVKASASQCAEGDARAGALAIEATGGRVRGWRFHFRAVRLAPRQHRVPRRNIHSDCRVMCASGASHGAILGSCWGTVQLCGLRARPLCWC